ncbi:MAG: serine/threonine protein kinase, partial [Gemmatimonadales bacterium]|nr:serine/threonine protein kinase [Gemmatimonadales bacterium]
MFQSENAPSPEFLALQAQVAGRYSLDRELGRGGMGIVFLAREVALDRLVAIKLLPPALTANASLRERFLREARTAAQLSHPHIVPIHAVESHEALVFFVMTYVRGETLGERLRARGALPMAVALRVMQEVSWAIAHAHARGVIHR